MIELATKEKAKCQANLERQIEMVRDVSARSSNKYVSSLYVALKDEDVRALWLEKVAHEFIPSFVQFEDTLIPEQVVVVFPFNCAPGTYCFLNPSFAVVVDWVSQKLVSILDPYLPGTHTTELSSSAGMMSRLAMIGSMLSDGHADLRYAGHGDMRSAGVGRKK